MYRRPLVQNRLSWLPPAAGIVLGFFLVGCGSREPIKQEVVVYAALDQEFSKPIFDDFTRETGIEVKAKYDTESTKTVGLVSEIIAERERPRCDLFWNNEMLNTLRLAKLGLLRPAALRARRRLPGRGADARTGSGTALRPGPACWWSTPNLMKEARRPDVDPRPDRSAVVRAGGDRQAAVRHHRDARRVPVRPSGAMGDAKDYFEGVKRNDAGS